MKLTHMLHANLSFLNIVEGPKLLKLILIMLLLNFSCFFNKFFEAEDQISIPNYSCNFLFTVSFFHWRLFSSQQNYIWELENIK